MSEAPSRPAVSLIVPFYDDAAAATAALAALDAVAVGPGDEIIVVDNTPGDVMVGAAQGRRVRAIASPVKASAYTARNVGAEATGADWLLFIDADCRPPSSLLDDYFLGPVAPDVGAIAGEVAGEPDQGRLVARYVRARGHLVQRLNLEHRYRPMAVTANLLVRREAWTAIGGFMEMTRSGADNDFCWRLQDAGWRLDYRPAATVHHHHRERLLPLLRQTARDGAGSTWIRRRYPGSEDRYPLAAGLARSVAGIAWWAVTRRRDRAFFKGIDALWLVAHNLGSLTSNRPPPQARSTPPAGVTVMMTEFPTADQAALVGALVTRSPEGGSTRVEALARPTRPSWSAAREVATDYAEDDGIGRRALDLAWLVCRHPIRCCQYAARRTGDRGRRRSLLVLAPCIRRFARSRGRALVAGDPGVWDDVAAVRSIVRVPGDSRLGMFSSQTGS